MNAKRKEPAMAATNKADYKINQVDDSTKLKVLSIISNGRATREDLVKLTGVSDRLVRKVISELRREGYNICSDSQGKGYWLGNEAETRKTIAEYKHRATKCFQIAVDMERRLELEGQVEADVLL